MEPVVRTETEELLAHSVDTTIVVDAEGVLLAVSPSVPFAFGHRVEDRIGRSALDFVHPEDAGSAIDSLRRSAATPGRHEPIGLRVLDGDGHWRPVELVASTVRGAGGPLVIAVRDRSGEEGHRELVADRTQLYRQIVELAAEGVWITDEHDRIVFSSPPMAEMLGYTREEMIGRHILDLIDTREADGFDEAVTRPDLSTPGRHLVTLVHRSGHPVWTATAATPLGTGDPYLGHIAVVSDISNEHLAGEAVDQERRRLRALLNAMPDLMINATADGTILDCSATWPMAVDADTGRLIGRNVTDVLPPEVHETALSTIRRALRSETVQEVEANVVVRGEERLYQSRMAPSGPDDVVGIVRDVTELRRAEQGRFEWEREVQRRIDAEERADLEERLHAAARLDSLGRLSGGIAHDVNNLLGVIGNYAAAIRHTTIDQGVLEDLAEIERAVRNGSELTKRLLLFGQREPQSSEPVPVDLVVSDVARVVARTCRESIGVVSELLDDGARVMVDRWQLEQAITNLVLNAVDASPDGATVTITTRRSVGPPPAPNGPDDQAARPIADLVEISVTDEGPGIPAALRDRVIEPFFTTKELGRGTGLGLAVVHGVVTDAGGRLDIDSGGTPGEPLGATMTVVLPMVADDGAVDPAENTSLLVVDDDPHGLSSITRLLRAYGIRVITAGGVDAALELVERHPEINAVLTDVVMPGRNGLELEALLRERAPSLPVVLMTGFVGAQGQEIPSDRTLLSKPIELDQLLDALDLRA